MSSNHPKGEKSVLLTSHTTPVLVIKKKTQKYVFIYLLSYEFKNLKPLTSDPVEIQLSVIGFFLRSQRLQCQLEFLSVK